jgi:tryptophanyl-tRNA synthetase
MNSTQATKKRVFSGVQPTGKLHIGNYVGALSQWAESQDRYDNIFCIVDLHALTMPEAVDGEGLREKTRELAALYIACGVDPEKCAIFVQSHVVEHAELTWVLNCVTPLGWLEKMTQFKAKSGAAKSVGTGLLDYPVLQAADILLYQTDLVPVGEDQKQHIELSRNIAQRFNHMFGEALKLPAPVIPKTGARIMGLDDPEAKMSKSVGEAKRGHSIGLLDPEKQLRKAIMSAVTDTENEARFERCSPGVLNLLTIYQALTKEAPAAIEGRFHGQGYGNLKKAVADVVIGTLKPVQEKYAEIREDPAYLESLLERGADRVRPIAQATMKRVRECVGIG